MHCTGRIIAVCIAPTEGGPNKAVTEAVAIAGEGLRGDRYCATGASSNTQLTLIESEVIGALNSELAKPLPVTAFRRNLVTEGVVLNSLVGLTFAVGEVQVQGIELCEPCAYLQDLLGVPDLVKRLTHKGGLRCEILEGGLIVCDSLVRYQL
jgi:MOSC domain-containing protein YiiM